MNQYILVFFNPAALACVAEAAATEAAKNGQIILPEQIKGYVKVLATNAYKIQDRVVMKLECEEIPAPYVEFAEAIFQAQSSGTLKTIKSLKRDAHVKNIAYSVDTERFPYMKITRSKAHAEEVRDPTATTH